MVRTRSDLLVMRVRRSSMSSSGDTTISVYRSMLRSERRNSARPSEKIRSDGAHAIGLVGDARAAQLNVVFRRHHDFGVQVDVAVGAAELGAALGEDPI